MSTEGDRRDRLVALAGMLRPELHRYCARLMGSVMDGEDAVQDTFMRALAALPELDDATPLRPWLFRIAHNRALDLLRARTLRQADPMEAADDLPDPANLDPAEALMRRDAVATAVSRFTQLPIAQRSAVILKDVLEESLADIAVLLGISVDAVKGHLARGRARLREIGAQPAAAAAAPPASAEVAHYVALFNARDWDGLRALLAGDVRLVQSTYPQQVGAAQVGTFFTIYARSEDVWLAPAWLEGREVIAVFGDRADTKPGYVMWLQWREGRIRFIRDYRYVRYVCADVEPVLAPPAARAAG